MSSFRRMASACAVLVATAAVVVGMPMAAHAGGGIVRDDDGGQNTVLDLDYGDDTAVKRLVLPSGIMTGATSATLSVYAQADACGLSGASQSLYVNGSWALDFNPCSYFSTVAPNWATFSISPSLLVSGTTNSFQIYEIAGDWTDRNAYYGVDTNNDFGRSDIYQSSSYFTGDIAGELMWYLTVVAPSGSPGVTVSPTSISFGTVAVGSSSSNQTVTVTSTGTASLTVSSVSVGGTNPGDFPKSSDFCTGATLSPGSSCTFQERFAPSAGGSRSATVTISTNAGTRTVSLSGTGASPDASVSPSSINFGTVAVGSASSNQTVTVTSTGSATLTVSSVTIGGTNPGDFTKSADVCSGTSVSPGLSCTFQVRFNPTAIGYRYGTVTVATNAGNRTVSLSGYGADTVAPTSTFNTANGAIIVSGGAVTGYSTDNASAISLVRVTFTPITSLLTSTTVTATRSGCGPTSCNWSAVAPLVPGVYLVNARATDAAGNTENPGPAISIIVL